MKRYLIEILFISLIFSSCKIGKGVVVDPVKELPLPVRVDTTVIPLFKPEVLYVLAREYEHSGDTLHSMGEYVEDRLIDMYPEKAYKGMIGKVGKMSMDRLQSVKRSPQNKRQIIDGLIIAQKNTSYFNNVSDSAEVDYMDMTSAEASVYWKLNELADGGELRSNADFDSIKLIDSDWRLDMAIMSDTLPYFIQEKWIMSAISLGMSSSAIYRILQSKARAEYVAKHYYKFTDLGRKGDAYKHIFVNLLLTKYTTDEIAWLVMDVYWERKSWNAPCDRIMDFHNNMIGRKYNYDELIEGSDDWRVWALRLRNYIENSDENGSYMDWHLDTPELNVKQEERFSPKEKYIYWNKGDKTVQQYVDRNNKFKDDSMKLVLKDSI